jgi:hypothetical protein
MLRLAADAIHTASTTALHINHIVAAADVAGAAAVLGVTAAAALCQVARELQAWQDANAAEARSL